MASPFIEQIDQMLAARAFDAVAAACDAAELALGADPLPAHWPHALHMVGHMLNGDLESARFVWKRAPAVVRESDAELRMAHALLQALWVRDYPLAHRALTSTEWSRRNQPAVVHLAESFRAATADLISRAYTTVSVSRVCDMLGFSNASDALAMGADRGWTVDAGGGGGEVGAGGGGGDMFFSVRRPSMDTAQRLSGDALQKLTEIAVHLSNAPVGS